MAITEEGRTFEEYETLKRSKEYRTILDGLNSRIEEVIQTARGIRTRHNWFGLRKQHTEELFHARFDDLVNPRWVAGREFHHASSVGEAIVLETIAAKGWEIVAADATTLEDPTKPIHSVTDFTVFSTPNGYRVTVRRYSTYANLRVSTNEENPEFIPGYDPHIDILITIESVFPQAPSLYSEAAQNAEIA